MTSQKSRLIQIIRYPFLYSQNVLQEKEDNPILLQSSYYCGSLGFKNFAWECIYLLHFMF